MAGAVKIYFRTQISIFHTAIKMFHSATKIFNSVIKMLNTAVKITQHCFKDGVKSKIYSKQYTVSCKY
jgi:hypothetical protein